MSFTTYINCKRNEKHDFLTLLTTHSNYRHKSNKRGSGIRMSWAEFCKNLISRGRLLGTQENTCMQGTNCHLSVLCFVLFFNLEFFTDALVNLVFNLTLFLAVL